MSIETMKQWLEALELSHPRFGVGTAIYIKAVATLRQAIEQAESVTKEAEKTHRFIRQLDQAIEQAQKQEPVAWGVHDQIALEKSLANYTSPPQRQWVGMTEDEVDQGLLKTGYAMKTAEAWRHGVEWAQFNLMRKNT